MNLPNTTTTPPGGWKFTVPETGKTIGPFTGFVQLRGVLKDYYATVGYPMPSDIFERVETQLCMANPDYCAEAYPGMSFGKAVAGTKHTFHAAVQCLATLM